MITLDQVQLLEKKVEMIVSKLSDLQRQNFALQEKNRDLIEQNSILKQKVSSFESDQNKIEQGILKALDRLNSMENTVLNVGSSVTNEQVQPNVSTQENVEQESLHNEEQSKKETTYENTNSQLSQEFGLTDFSNISESEQNFAETNENSSTQESPSLDFSEENINETENSNEESLNFGLNLDFDSNVENSDNSQLEIF